MSIAEWRAGRISAEVALARLVLDGGDLDRIAAELANAPDAAPLLHLFEARRAELARMQVMMRESGADHAEGSSVARIRAMFDTAVRHSPEASVAAYSLGDRATLARATEEIVAWLAGMNLLDADGDALDVGCGIGRVAAALAPHMREVLGIDISPAMIAEAQRRHGGDPKLRFAVTDGIGLAHLQPRRFALVLAVDSFPYLMQADPALAERHVREARDLLVPRGALVILNLSYSEEPARAAEWARRYDYVLRCDGEHPFRLWDGAAFVLSRAAG